MLLSILIPTHNRDCSQLVQELLSELPEEAEIIIGNDKSTDKDTIAACQLMAGWKHCRVYEPQENLGRSRIRNRLMQLSTGKWLLFMDADTKPTSPLFIRNYLEAAEQHPADIYFGGMINTKECPNGCELRWTYESRHSARHTVEYRQTHPYSSMTTQNCMISRQALSQSPFTEEITGYGYEDTILFDSLMRKGKRAWHIDNPLIHLDIDTNEHFLAKTREALRTLHSLPIEIRPDIPIVRMYNSLQRRHLYRLLALVHLILLPITRRILCSRFVSIKLLQFYKLGYLCSL